MFSLLILINISLYAFYQFKPLGEMFQTQLTLTKWFFHLFSDSLFSLEKKNALKKSLYFLALYFFLMNSED